jgi:hypothetical protein
VARIRTLKPTFWSDEKLGLISREARYTFIGLISAMADDHGRLSGNARIIRGAVYPFDDDVTAGDVAEHLTQLAAAGRIDRYSVNGDDYIAITHWTRHQKVDKPSRSLIPSPSEAFVDDSSNDRRTIVEQSTTIPAVVGGEGSGSGKEERTTPTTTTDAERAVLLEAFPKLADALPPRDGHDVLLAFALWAPDKRAYLAEAAASLDGMRGYVLTPDQLRTAITDWLANNPKPNMAYFRGYLKKAREADGVLGARSPPRRGGTVAERTWANGVAALKGL